MEATAQRRSGACPAAASFFPVRAQQVATNGVRCTKASNPVHAVTWLHISAYFPVREKNATFCIQM